MANKPTSSALNAAYSSLTMRRRYEVWFLRLALADKSGGWWFRYLVMNPGRNGCMEGGVLPVQVWATRFAQTTPPENFLQGFPKDELSLSSQSEPNFELKIGENWITPDTCGGHLQLKGHQLRWDLRYRSRFAATLSNKGWIGFSKTPHSDAVFSGRISFDGESWSGEELGTGVQGHNCGVRHRKFWTWMHAYFTGPAGTVSTLEALTYEMPLGLTFRRAILWHSREPHVFGGFSETRRDPSEMLWQFTARAQDGSLIEVDIRGPKASTIRLPYFKTDCSGTFEVSNNSLAHARVRLFTPGGGPLELETALGAVLEMAGAQR